MKDQTFHVGFPNLPDSETLHKALDDILTSHRLTNNGPYVRSFEQRITEFLSVKHAIAVCNATIGLQIVAKALGLSGTVIIPSFTFVATAHAMEWIGLKPIFCDVFMGHNIAPMAAERLIDDRTSAILGVHLWGNPCSCRLLESIADRHGLKLFFDAAHAFGCSYGGRKVGSFGSAEVFSFHATKCINSFEGGAITTNDDDLADQCTRMRNFGFVGYDDVQSTGTNGKMSEVHAAMGLAMLDLFPSIVAENRERFRLYFDRLSNLNGVLVLEPNAYEEHNYQYVVIEVKKAMTGISRDRLLEKLQEVGIIARRYFYPGVHRMPLYNTTPCTLPITERLCDEVLVLPTGPSLSLDDVSFICDTIEGALS